MDIETLSQGLAALAPKLAPGGVLAGEPRRLSGGASQETWAFVVRGGDGGERPLILRRRPDGMASDPERTASLGAEAALIRAAGTVGAPVPGVPHVCTEEDGIGEAYVMERVEGETLGKRIVAGEVFAGVRPGLARRCGEVLAAIHSVPMEGLPPLATSDAETELDKYETIYRNSGARRPVFELAFKRLRRAAAPPPARMLVHGGFSQRQSDDSPQPRSRGGARLGVVAHWRSSGRPGLALRQFLAVRRVSQTCGRVWRLRRPARRLRERGRRAHCA